MPARETDAVRPLASPTGVSQKATSSGLAIPMMYVMHDDGDFGLSGDMAVEG